MRNSKYVYYILGVISDMDTQRAFAVTSAGIEGGKNLAESAQDLERTRKAINVQLAEFDGVKKSLMRDLQNRCEKVSVETIKAFVYRSCSVPRSLSSRFNLMKSKNSTITLSATATAKRSKRRWHSWSATWTS